MRTRDEVIKALECCKDYCDEETGCPYYGDGEAFECEEQMRKDAIALLKAQEPRIMTLEEVKSATGSDLFLEISGHPDTKPYMTAVTLEGVGSKGISVYGNTFDFVRYNLRAYGWRLWTSRPTDEQRERTPWA